jgi:ComF family protein
VKFQHALDALASVLFPAPCRICAAPLLRVSRIPICDACLHAFERIVDPMCAHCGRPFASPVMMQIERPLCRLCRADFYAFDRARSFAIYNDALSGAILLMKYDEVTRLGNWFADRLFELISAERNEWRADAVVPVPLHVGRLRERGYNQAELIARPLAKRLGLPVRPRLLVRTVPRPPQQVLSRTEHWKSVRGAYVTHKSARVDNLRLLLVDDVMTTGATLDACSRGLKRAGASLVLGLTVGRVVPGWYDRGRFAQVAANLSAGGGNPSGTRSIL